MNVRKCMSEVFYFLFVKIKLITIEYHQSLDGTIVFKRELMQTIKIDKYLRIPEDCDAVKSLKLF